MATAARPMTGAERFLAAAARQPCDRTPVWFMRQAGRALPGYRALREQHDILTMVRTPELATEVTLMPVRELGVDAAVLYADIMMPLVGMGVPFTIDPGVGPVIAAPVRDAAAIRALRIVDAEGATPEIFAALRMIRHELDGRTALLGFAGAPFTLASYLIEGRPTRDFARSKALMHGEPELWDELMTTLSEVTIGYLSAQVGAGAQALQLFDSWVGALSRRDYQRAVQPHVRRIFDAVASLDVPLIHFATGATHLLPAMADTGCDVVSVDWRTGLDEAWSQIGERAIQGNLDPAVCLAGWPVVEGEVRRILGEAAGRPGHIFNLGHGVLPQTQPETLRSIVELVHAAGRSDG